MQPAAEPPALPRLPAEADWPAFVDTYGRAILENFHSAGLTTDQAAPLMQAIMPILAREFAQIRNEPTVRFRPWLQYAAHTAWCRVMEERVDTGGNSPEVSLLLSVEAHDNFLKALDAECTHQRRREVLPRAQAEADPADWEAFYLAVLEGLPVAEVARQLSSPELAVHAALYRVNAILQRELKKLDEEH